MFTIIQQIVQGLVSGIFQPLMSYLGKKTDDQLAGFQTGAGIDAAAYGAFLNYQIAIGAQKAAANSWWGAPPALPSSSAGGGRFAHGRRLPR